MIDWSIDGSGVARVMLDRPVARNAIAIADWAALAAATRAIAESDASAVIIASAVAGIFSAGADLVEMSRLADEPDRRVVFRETMRGAIETVAALPMPVIAAIDGGCYGAGVALALAADLRIAGEDAAFATTPAKLGIGYPGEDVARLAALVGRGQAARLLLTAQTIDGREAARIGLVETLAPNALVAAASLAAQMAALSPEALRLLKSTIADPLAEGRDARFDDAFGGAAFVDRLAAFKSRAR